ncbi:uncharacterized protein LOC129292353 [Prosopis cineraria]|uniref:uncharacterized protein LOC129292353 n=1 Tax=Prosopis cineraria TaxID=364024 RepID=UPI00240EC823|nr:uncharacterized protein LOC129292353 [Prosopis cineraria]
MSMMMSSSEDKLLKKYTSMADFLKFKREGDARIGELQTAIVSYRNKSPLSSDEESNRLLQMVQVDLVSTIHMADKEYYQALQKELESYDCVLYEMVAPKKSIESGENTNPEARKRASRKTSFIRFKINEYIQSCISGILKLDHQMAFLNYQAANWYHADLDEETFTLRQRERGENMFSLSKDATYRYLKAMMLKPKHVGLVLPLPLVGRETCELVRSTGGIIGQALAKPEIEALKIDFASAIKAFIARKLTNKFLAKVISQLDEKSVVVGVRNQISLCYLKKAINDGHKRIAILYGAGHMADLGKRLRWQLGFEPVGHPRWITAWSIEKKEMNNTSSSSCRVLKTMARVLGWRLNRCQTLTLLMFLLVLRLDFWLLTSYVLDSLFHRWHPNIDHNRPTLLNIEKNQSGPTNGGLSQLSIEVTQSQPTIKVTQSQPTAEIAYSSDSDPSQSQSVRRGR